MADLKNRYIVSTLNLSQNAGTDELDVAQLVAALNGRP